MTARDIVFLACFGVMVLDLFCAVAGVPLLVCVAYFIVPLFVMTWACFDPDF